MNRFALVVVGLLALAVLGVSLALPRVSEQAFTYASRPQPSSPAELVLESRQVTPESHQGLGGVGWLALVLVGVGAVTLLLRYGSEALRQWRLLRGRSSYHRPLHSIPTMPPHDYPALPTTHSVPTVPQQIPGGNQHES